MQEYSQFLTVPCIMRGPTIKKGLRHYGCLKAYLSPKNILNLFEYIH